MIKRLPTLFAFFLGCIFTVALLVRCGVPGGKGSGGTHGATGSPGNTGSTGNMMMTADATDLSGTRIKVKTYTGSDGSATFVGLHDSQLNVDCQWGVASDGTTRCLPVAATMGYFSDMTCTTMIAFSSESCAPYAYGSITTPNTCPAQTVIHQLGSSISSGPIYYQTGQPATPCGMLWSTLPAGWRFWNVGAVVSPSTFVQASLSTG